MKTKSLVAVLVLLFVVGLMIGCTSNIKPVDEMTPKEKATFFLSMYNKQYDDYQAMASRADLTEAQKEFLREKKKVLTEVYPLIKMYADYVDAGSVPSAETEAQIINYLNRLSTSLTQ